MTTHRFVLSALAVASLALAGTSAMAGTTHHTAKHPTAVEKACKVAHKNDDAGYKKCVSEKQATGSTKQ